MQNWLYTHNFAALNKIVLAVFTVGDPGGAVRPAQAKKGREERGVSGRACKPSGY